MALLDAEVPGVVAVYVVLVLLAIVAIILRKGFVVVRHAEVMIVERFGKYRHTLKPGLHWLWPGIDKPRRIDWRYVDTNASGSVYVRKVVSHRIDMREHVIDFGRQHVITKDTVSIDIDALVYYRITDPVLAVYHIQNLPDAIEMLTQSTLRNIIAHMTLDDTFSSRELISTQLKERTLHDAERWGVTLTRVENMNILPPADIKSAMELQIREERERRALVISADGERESQIIRSFGDAAQLILNAEGSKTARVQRAKGEAEAKLLLAQAESRGIALLSDALQALGVRATEYLVALQYMNAFSTMAMSRSKQSSVVLVPRESIAGLSDLLGTPDARTGLAH